MGHWNSEEEIPCDKSVMAPFLSCTFSVCRNGYERNEAGTCVYCKQDTNGLSNCDPCSTRRRLPGRGKFLFSKWPQLELESNLIQSNPILSYLI